jgi:hypothetical protein
VESEESAHSCAHHASFVPVTNIEVAQLGHPKSGVLFAKWRDRATRLKSTLHSISKAKNRRTAVRTASFAPLEVAQLGHCQVEVPSP